MFCIEPLLQKTRTFCGRVGRFIVTVVYITDT